jgi:hypothetical protein
MNNTVMQVEHRNFDEEVSNLMMLIESSKDKIKEGKDALLQSLLAENEYKDQYEAQEYSKKRMSEIVKIRKESDSEFSEKLAEMKQLKKGMKEYKKQLKELTKEAAAKGKTHLAGKQIVIQYTLF